MNSLLVALLVHLLNDPAGVMAGNMPFYVVPAKAFGSISNGEPLTLTTSTEFGPAEKAKWAAVLKVVGTPQMAAEFCYRAAYADIKHGLAGMKVPEAEAFLVQSGGYHVLARAAVRTCNISIRKLDVLPLGHPEFASAERSLREQGYMDDMVFLRNCTTDVCRDKGPAALARGIVGVPLDAER